MTNHQSINKRIYNVEAPINYLQRWLQTEGSEAITLEFSEGIGYQLDGLGWVRIEQFGADVLVSYLARYFDIHRGHQDEAWEALSLYSFRLRPLTATRTKLTTNCLVYIPVVKEYWEEILGKLKNDYECELLDEDYQNTPFDLFIGTPIETLSGGIKTIRSIDDLQKPKLEGQMIQELTKDEIRKFLPKLRTWLEDNYSMNEINIVIMNMGQSQETFSQANIKSLTLDVTSHIRRRWNEYPNFLQAIIDTRPDDRENIEEELVQFGWIATNSEEPEPEAQPAHQPRVDPQPAEPIAPTVKEFINFDLRVYPKMGNGTAYMIEASHDYRGGAGSGLIPQELDINSPEFQELSEYLQDLIGEHGDATQFGQTLYDFLFPAKVREIYRELQTYGRLDKKGIRLRLRVEEPELNRIPWEYCYNEDDRFFLAQDRNAPFVRHIERGRVPESLEAPMPLKILLVTAEPSNQKPLDIAEEERRLRDILGEMSDLVQLETLHHASPETLQTAVTSFQPHVLHYIGHGTFDENRQEGALLFEQNNDQRLAQPFYAYRLGNTLRSSSVRLVVLNACKTSAEAEGKAFMGVAPALVIAGIPAVIAMQFNVPDRMAIRFTTALYKYLVQATPLDEAVTEMRIYAANGPEAYDRVWWAIPTLFMRAENGEIWRSTPERDARTAVLPPTDTIAANAAAPLTITKTITPPPDGGAFTLSQTISGSSGGININNSGNFNVGGNVTNIGGNQINNYGSTAQNPDEVRQSIKSLQVKFQPALPQLDAADAADFNRNMEEAHTAVAENVARARRKLKNALEIAEDINGIDPLLNELEALYKRVEAIAG